MPSARALRFTAFTTVATLAALAACGGSVSSPSSGFSDDATKPDTCSGSTSGGPCPPNGRVPKNHRATATPCDGTRPTTEPVGIPDGGASGYVACRTNEECTQGVNGRCSGNGHDGWHCTYDECTTDGDCKGGKVCQCGGGFRADNDVCLESGCRVDADCGPNGYCSPSLGDCGNYSGVAGWFCHSAADECVDDADCASKGENASCRYEPSVGYWRCSTQACAG